MEYTKDEGRTALPARFAKQVKLKTKLSNQVIFCYLTAYTIQCKICKLNLCANWRSTIIMTHELPE